MRDDGAADADDAREFGRFGLAGTPSEHSREKRAAAASRPRLAAAMAIAHATQAARARSDREAPRSSTVFDLVPRRP